MKLRVLDPVLGGMIIAAIIGYCIAQGEAKKHPKVVMKEKIVEVQKECPKPYPTKPWWQF